MRSLGRVVRPGLVVAGMVFLTLGIGLVASLYLASSGNATTATIVTPYPTLLLSAHATESLPISGSNGTTEQVNLTWRSNVSINLVFQSPAGCSQTCWPSTALASWPSNTSGSWSGSGSFHYPLLCILKNPGPTAANVTLVGRTVATTETHPSIGFDLAVGGGAVALIAVGALAVFLGFFLRRDPYGPPAPLTSRSAEDVGQIASEERPGH